jgi:hypothetical protein
MRRHHPDTSSDSDEDRYAIVPYQRADDEFDPAMHARLCFGLGPREKDDGFQMVRNQGIKPVRTYNDEEIKRFSEIYRDYFRGLTGIQLQTFRLTQATHKYVSMLEFARGRDRILSTLFERRPKIWDLHAGSGADSFAFLMDLDPVEVVMCQRSVPDDERHDTEDKRASEREYKIMCDNMKDFLKATKLDVRLDIDGDANALPEGPKQRHIHVKCKHMLAENFIMSSRGKEVDIVYLDPSWDDDRDSGGKAKRGAEMTPAELFRQLDRLIWQPIKLMNIKVGCYVIKTRWNWLKIQNYINEVNSEFVARFSVRTHPFRPDVSDLQPDEYGGVRGVYHYMILTHKEYKTIELENSQMYWDIVRNNVPVWVKKSTCVGIIKPLYSNHTQFPVYTETQPGNTGAYFKINAHGKPRQDKAVGPVNPEEHASYDSQRYEPANQPTMAPVQDYEPDQSYEPDQPYSSYNRYKVLPEESEARLNAAASASSRP